MVLSMVVLLIPIALVVFVFRARGGEDAVVVDPSAAIIQAQQAKAFPVAAPTGLPAEWKCVSATFTRAASGATLRIGYVAPDGGGVQLIESSEPVDALLVRELGDNVRPIGTVAAGGATWDSFQARGAETALVFKGEVRTLIVIGHAPIDQLVVLAGSLR